MPDSDPSRRRTTPRTLLVALACAIGLAPAALAASAQAQETPAADEVEATSTTTTTTESAPAPEAEAPAEETDDTEDPESGDSTDPVEETDETDGADTAAAADEQAKRRLRLTVERTSTDKAFYDSKRKVEFTFKFAGNGRRDLRVQAIRKSGRKIAMGWKLDDAKAGVRQRVRWNAATRKGRPVKGGQYYFRVQEQDGPEAVRSKAKGNRTLKVFQHKFPVRARHSYGDGFGAGRGHQGVDVFAKCGAKMVAARAGKVQYRGYQGSAGNYIVIDGRATGRDYVYMHLKRPAKVREGRRVKTGQTIGRVGETGNASGCHLHMEVWSSPGWYEGGKASRKIKKIVKGWDRYS